MAWKRGEHSSSWGLPCTGMEMYLTVVWTWFGMAGSEDDYREGGRSCVHKVTRSYLEEGFQDQLLN